ncbi:MAG: hypothetical protein B6I20_04165 [Bacteroidetes bacterium 4572_117]|nr:MAG: hypothetical protein B6I20_04165 [Bacteroidetes bacterium 4572_117]
MLRISYFFYNLTQNYDICPPNKMNKNVAQHKIQYTKFPVKINKSLYLLLVFQFITIFSLKAQLNISVYINKARQEIMDNKNQKAIERLNTVIKVKPNLYDAYFYRGIAKFGMGDYIGAIKDFSETIKINPFLPVAYQYRGISKDALHNYNSSLNDLDIAINMDINNSQLYMARGLTKIHTQNFSAAIEDFDKSIKLQPKNEDCYIYRAVAKAGLKNYESAIKDCNMAIGLNQFKTRAFVRRGLIFYEQKQYKKAIKNYNLALKINPKDAYAYYVRALAKYKLDDLNGTLADYSKVIELNKYNALAYYNRAMLFSQSGSLNKAVADLKQVSQINPEHILTHYNRGQIQTELNNYHEAIADFSKAIEIYPEFGEAYYMRAMAKRKIGDIRSAKTDYDIATKKLNTQNTDSSNIAINTIKYRRLIELEANFNNNFIGDDKIYSVFSGIDPLPDFFVSLNQNKKAYNKTNYMGINDIINEIPKPLTPNIAMFDTISDNNLLIATVDSIWGNLKKNEIYWFLIGTIELRNKNFNLSLNAFSKAINENNDFALAYYNRAYCNLKMIDFINSIDQEIQITVAGQKKPFVAKTEMTNDYTKILEDYNKALGLKPDYAIIYYNRANLKVRAKSYTSALYDYNRAIQLEPEFAEAFYNKALIHIHLKEFKLACSALSKAGELGLKQAYVVIKRYCGK